MEIDSSRLRERDFEELHHVDGISPAWPTSYHEFDPFPAEAEALVAVHGSRGEDPTEPWSSGGYAHPAISHEPRIQKPSDDWAKDGLHPFHPRSASSSTNGAAGRPRPRSGSAATRSTASRAA